MRLAIAIFAAVVTLWTGVILSAGAASAEWDYWIQHGGQKVAKCPGNTGGASVKLANPDGQWIYVEGVAVCKDAGPNYTYDIKYLKVAINDSRLGDITRNTLNFDWLGMAVYRANQAQAPAPALTTPVVPAQATGREIRTFTGHTDLVTSVSFSPDGRTALSGSSDKTLKLWDIASGSAPSAPPPSPSDRVSQGDTAQTPQAPAPPSATPVVPAQATVTDLLNGKKISMSIRCRRNQPSQNTVSGVSLNSQGNLMYSSRGNVPLEIVNGRARDSLFKYSATVSGNELTVVTTPATGDLSLRTTDTFKVSGNSCSATHTVDNGGMLEIDDTCKATSCTVASAP